MKIKIKVKPNSKRPGVEALSDGSFEVRVNAPAREGKANDAVVELVARHFRVPPSDVRLVRGLKGREKELEIDLTRQKFRQ